MNIRFKVDDQFVKRIDNIKLVAGTTDYIYAEFYFSKEWENFEKTVQFTRDPDTYNVAIVDGTCKVPWEIIQTAGGFTVSVFGGDLFTSSVGVIDVIETGYVDDGSFPADPTPSYFEDVTVAEDERVAAEIIRLASEITREGSETDRIAQYNLVAQKLIDGDFIGEQGIQGNGISSVVRTAGDGTEGTTDTYTITYTDTTTTTFAVYNGADGEVSLAQLEDLAGSGRTTETVKANKDNLDTHLYDYAEQQITIKNYNNERIILGGYGEVRSPGEPGYMFDTLEKDNKYYLARTFTILKGTSSTNVTSRTLAVGTDLSQVLIYGIGYRSTVYTHTTNTIDVASYVYYGANLVDDFGELLSENRDYIAINLTETFGAGNEPTKEEMDELIKLIPNQWFDGELTLTQKQIMIWTLNVQRLTRELLNAHLGV